MIAQPPDSPLARPSDDLTARFQNFTDALSAHLDALEESSNEADIQAAYDRAAAAFDDYETHLFAQYNEVTPLDLA